MPLIALILLSCDPVESETSCESNQLRVCPMLQDVFACVYWINMRVLQDVFACVYWINMRVLQDVFACVLD